MKEEKKKIEFKSNYVLDEETYKEFVKGYNNSRVLAIVILSVFTISLIYNVIYKQYIYVISYGLFVLFFTLFIKLVNNTKRYYKRTLITNNGKPQNITITIGDKIVLKNNDNKNKTEYQLDQVIGLVETKNLIILKLDYNLGLIINKNDLQGGNVSDLTQYLNRVCINIKKSETIKAQKNKKYIRKFVIYILFAVVLAAITFQLTGDSYFNKLKKNLVDNKYIIEDIKEDYKNMGAKEAIKVSDENNNYYIFMFDGIYDAKNAMNHWTYDLNNLSCKQSSNYKRCDVNDYSYKGIFIRKDKYVIYVYVLKEHYDDALNFIDITEKAY